MAEKKTVAPETRQSEPAATIPDDAEQSVYRFIIVAAKRARHLQSGARPKIHAPTRKMTRVAIEEVRKGLVQWVDPQTAQPAAEEEEESTSQ